MNSCKYYYDIVCKYYFFFQLNVGWSSFRSLLNYNNSCKNLFVEFVFFYRNLAVDRFMDERDIQCTPCIKYGTFIRKFLSSSFLFFFLDLLFDYSSLMKVLFFFELIFSDLATDGFMDGCNDKACTASIKYETFVFESTSRLSFSSWARFFDVSFSSEFRVVKKNPFTQRDPTIKRKKLARGRNFSSSN